MKTRLLGALCGSNFLFFVSYHQQVKGFSLNSVKLFTKTCQET